MELASQILQFILCISILVILHELGHFIPAKLFKTKVEKFYLFFDPWFSLAKKKIGETEYGIGWLPFGGYVKIAGMIDESMDTEQMKQPAQPWEFRSKPAWQRLIIMLGGVTVNFFLAWIIYSILLFTQGENYSQLSKMKGGLDVSPAAQKMGLKTGDFLLKIDGKTVEKYQESQRDLLFSDNFTVLRGNKELTLPTNEDGIAEILKSNEVKSFISQRFRIVVDSILPNKMAQKIGLQKGDKIVSFNRIKINYFDELKTELLKNTNKNVVIEIERNNQIITKNFITPSDGKLGFTNDSKLIIKDMEDAFITKKYSFLECIPQGYNQTIGVLTGQIKQFKIIFNTKTQGYKKVAGPIGIIKQMPKEFDWVAFWSFSAFFSIWLAFLNLLPIPGLDGGHVVFTTWELITGKPVPQKILENAQMVGVIFLMSLMLLLFGSDIFKAIFN